MDMITGQPQLIVHNFIQGKKLAVPITKDKKYGSDLTHSGRNSITCSPQDKQPGTDVATDRSYLVKSPRMQKPQPAGHVGVLKVPDSLKQKHISAMFGVEQVVNGGGMLP